jgi:hypothetical protein
MASEDAHISTAGILGYLQHRPRAARWTGWLRGRRYTLAQFPELERVSKAGSLFVIAHSFRDAAIARGIAAALEKDWALTPARSREAYEEILYKAPELIVIQLRRRNVCGCLGHRHVFVREAPFREQHEILAGIAVGEMDIAYQPVETWAALPLSDTALDAKFLEGSRQQEFRAQQFRLKLLSIALHEVNHLVFPREPENTVRERSLAFYRESLAAYVKSAVATLSLTIDRSFSRFGS